MKLKLDENLGRRGADLFTQAGHDVMTVAAQGMSSAPDEQLVAACHAEGRCLVTLDLDFSNPLRFPPHHFSGLAVIRAPSPLTLRELLQCCRTLIAGLSQDAIIGKLWIIESSRIRRYQPDEPPPSRED